MAQINPLGNTVTSLFDADDRLTRRWIRSPTAQALHTTHRAARSLPQTPRGISTTVYDADGRTLATINAKGFATTQVYDAVGQRLAIIDARGNRISFT